jgi:predicted ATPase
MRERFRLLTAGRNRAAPARQQALRSALEWSYGLLEPREQQVFRRLGVVAGSASLGFLQRLLVDIDHRPGPLGRRRLRSTRSSIARWSR